MSPSVNKAVVLLPHHPHSISLLFASEWAQELEEEGEHDINEV